MGTVSLRRGPGRARAAAGGGSGLLPGHRGARRGAHLRQAWRQSGDHRQTASWWAGSVARAPSRRFGARRYEPWQTARLAWYGSSRSDEAGAAAAHDSEVVLQTTCPSGGTLEIFLEPYLARPATRRYRTQPRGAH